MIWKAKAEDWWNKKLLSGICQFQFDTAAENLFCQQLIILKFYRDIKKKSTTLAVGTTSSRKETDVGKKETEVQIFAST